MVFVWDRRQSPQVRQARMRWVASELGRAEMQAAEAQGGAALMSAQRLLLAVQQGRRRFLREIPERLRRVVDAAADQRTGATMELAAGQAGSLRRELHSLIGTAGTLGFLAIGEHASALHALLWQRGERESIDPAQREAALAGLVAAGMRAQRSDGRSHEAPRHDAPSEPIAVLDDDEMQRSVIEASLELAGYRAAAFADPLGLPAALAAQPACLLVLDWDLGAQSGADVLRALRTQPATRELPVVVFSSHQEDAMLYAMFEAGANGFVSKLDTMQALLDRIDQQLDALAPSALPRS